MKVFAELNEAGDRIDVHFRYDPQAVAAIKQVPGARFVPKDKGGPLWRLPLDLVTGSRLREQFGAGLTLGDGLKAWGRQEVAKQRNLSSLTRANDAELHRLPKIVPELAEFISGRPYQRADIAMMAETNVLNANQPGTGKTIEVIGSWVEAGIWDEGPHLVIAPVKSLVNVWAEELRWLPIETYTAEGLADRRQVIDVGLRVAEQGKPAVIVVNPDFLRLKGVDPDKPDPPLGIAKRDNKGNTYTYRDELQRRLFDITFKSCTIDEFHKFGLSNRKSLFSLGMSLVKSEKKAALSGTPMGGRPRKLWAVLNWLEPQEYTSEWRWIDQWLEVTDNGFGKDVGNIQPGREDEFYAAHARHIVRRLKRDALPGLPPQVHVVVKCDMTPGQKKQYEDFARDAEVRIDEERLSATNILAEYQRLKQFANAKQTLRDGVPYPTVDSGKLEQLIQKLDEEGIRKDDPEPGARAIIASESSRFVNTTAEFLLSKGIACDTMTGETKDSTLVINKFKSDDPAPYCIVMTIQTGGVSLNLQEADSIHALDETWNPDDMEQLFDRADRGSRETPLKCYTYRTKDSIQEYISEVSEGKKITNRNILDIRRRMYNDNES